MIIKLGCYTLCDAYFRRNIKYFKERILVIIYVSGPYSAEKEEDRLKNTQTAIDIGIELIRKGHTVLIPHLSHYTDMRAQELGIELPLECWMKQDLELLEGCDALFFIGESKGACIELERAKELGLQIFYSMEEVPGVKVEE